jgi:hypothetical protein
MAILVRTDVYLTVDGVNLSDHTKSLTVTYSPENKDVTAMGTAGQRTFRMGLNSPSIKLELYNDQASGSVSSIFRALVSANSTGATYFVRGASTATTTINPSYTMQGLIEGDIDLLKGEVGEVDMISVTVKPYSAMTISTTAT